MREEKSEDQEKLETEDRTASQIGYQFFKHTATGSVTARLPNTHWKSWPELIVYIHWEDRCCLQITLVSETVTEYTHYFNKNIRIQYMIHQTMAHWRHFLNIFNVHAHIYNIQITDAVSMFMHTYNIQITDAPAIEVHRQRKMKKSCLVWLSSGFPKCYFLRQFNDILNILLSVDYSSILSWYVNWYFTILLDDDFDFTLTQPVSCILHSQPKK